MTQKQITIVKIDNRKQVRKRSNAVATAPPPVLRGVSAIPQPIIPLPPPPDLYETNVLRQRVERLERVRQPVREPIRASVSTGTQVEPPPAPAPAPVSELSPARREILRERLLSGVEQRITQGQAREREQMGRFDPITERERLRPVADEPFRREAPAPQFITGLNVSRATENKLRNEELDLATLRLTNEDELREMGIPQTDLNRIKDFLTSSI